MHFMAHANLLEPFSTVVFSAEAEQQQGEWLSKAQLVPGCSQLGEEIIPRHANTWGEEDRLPKPTDPFEEFIPLRWSQSSRFSCLPFSLESATRPVLKTLSLWHLFEGAAAWKDAVQDAATVRVSIRILFLIKIKDTFHLKKDACFIHAGIFYTLKSFISVLYLLVFLLS